MNLRKWTLTKDERQCSDASSSLRFPLLSVLLFFHDHLVTATARALPCLHGYICTLILCVLLILLLSVIPHLQFWTYLCIYRHYGITIIIITKLKPCNTEWLLLAYYYILLQFLKENKNESCTLNEWQNGVKTRKIQREVVI